MIFSLCSKWCWPSVKWCCTCGTNKKIDKLLSKLVDFWQGRTKKIFWGVFVRTWTRVILVICLALLGLILLAALVVILFATLTVILYSPCNLQRAKRISLAKQISRGYAYNSPQGEYNWKTTKFCRILSFFWQGRKDSNPGHPVLETGVLPTELHP